MPRHTNDGRKHAASGAIATTPARWARAAAAAARSARMSAASPSSPDASLSPLAALRTTTTATSPRRPAAAAPASSGTAAARRSGVPTGRDCPPAPRRHGTGATSAASPSSPKPRAALIGPPSVGHSRPLRPVQDAAHPQQPADVEQYPDAAHRPSGAGAEQELPGPRAHRGSQPDAQPGEAGENRRRGARPGERDGDAALLYVAI